MKIDNATAAVVPGGASGLGKASAEALAAAGVKVAIFDLNEEAGEAIAKQLGGVFCKVDITSEESVLAGFEKARAANGQERVVVHCAVVAGGGKTVGYDKTTGGYKRAPTEGFAKSMEGIATATYRVASIAALGMATAEPLNEDGERGSIILTSGPAAGDGRRGGVAGGGGRGGVTSGAPPGARALMAPGTRVTAPRPAPFAPPPMLRVKEHAPAVFEGLGNAVPFPRRLGNPEEFASLVLELARNTYINGQLIRIDGAIRMPPK